MLTIKLATIIVPTVSTTIHSAIKTLSPVFSNDVAFFNKIHQIYLNLQHTITSPFHQKLLGEIPMGYLYLMIIAYMFAPLLGKLIGLIINRIIGTKVA